MCAERESLDARLAQRRAQLQLVLSAVTDLRRSCEEEAEGKKRREEAEGGGAGEAGEAGEEPGEVTMQ